MMDHRVKYTAPIYDGQAILANTSLNSSFHAILLCGVSFHLKYDSQTPSDFQRMPIAVEKPLYRGIGKEEKAGVYHPDFCVLRIAGILTAQIVPGDNPMFFL